MSDSRSNVLFRPIMKRAVPSIRGFGQKFHTSMEIIWDDWRGRLGILIILGYLLMGILGVVVIQQPTSSVNNRLLVPFAILSYPLGTDGAGKGLFAQVVHATPTMLKMIIADGICAIMLGAIIGMVAEYN